MRLFLAICVCFFSVSCSFGQSKSDHLKSLKPFILGVIDEMHSAVLGEERVLNIYLPEGYNADDTMTYPVIYLLDGSADEDFIHIAGLVQYNSFPWIDQVPKSIVVGIATVDRERDLASPTSIPEQKAMLPTSGHSEKFIAFLQNELIPYIGAHYAVNTDRTLIGQSLGGLFATEVLLRTPTLFNKYIIVSPSLWWNDGALLRIDSPVLSEEFEQPTEIYIGVGKEGVTPTVPRVMEVDANLLADKLRQSQSDQLHIYFDYLPEENHATIMHQAVANAFRVVYAKAGNE